MYTHVKVRIELLRASYGNWHWQMTEFRSGRRIGSSTEHYRRRVGAIKNLESVTGFVVPTVDLDKSRDGRYCWIVEFEDRVWAATIIIVP